MVVFESTQDGDETKGGVKMNSPKLKSYITAAGYTQRSLAAELHKSSSNLNRKINGLTPFDIVEAATLCSLLGISTSEDKVDIFLR